MKYFLRRPVLLAGLVLIALALLAPVAQAQPMRGRPIRMFPASTRVFPGAARAFPGNFRAFPGNFRPFPAYGGAFPRYGQAFPVVQNNYPAFIPTQVQRDALRNWAYQTQVIGQTYASLPPWLYGYNPYPPVNLGPVYSYPNYPSYGTYGYVPPFPPALPRLPATPAYFNPYPTYFNPNPTYFNPYAFYTPPAAPAPVVPAYSGAVNPYAVY